MPGRLINRKLEDMLCDCAVIRVMFETSDLFPADAPIREEMQAIINATRANMCRLCAELYADVANLMVIDRPLDIEEFSRFMRTLLLDGYPHRRIDAYMKLNVFQSVAKKEAGENEPDPLYRYELLPPLTARTVFAMSAIRLISAIFEDLARSIEANANYADKYTFDRNVFQKYVAIMFACYASTNPLFYA